MVAGGVKLGLSEDLAKKLSIATIYGSGHMLFYYDKSAQELRKDVTSPNGTTAAAMDILEIELPLLVDRVFNNDQ